MYEKEYESLRCELNDNKKYVFERPLIIFTAACVFFDYVSKTDYVMLFPCLIILLLLFNLNFTCNRLNSNARIIGYIRLFIEKQQPENYQWETFLDKYRHNGKGEKTGLRYYPIIFKFHISMILILIFLEILLYFDGHQLNFHTCYGKNEIITIVSIIILLVCLLYLFSILKDIYPKYVKEFFELETKKVIDVLDEMKNINKV